MSALDLTAVCERHAISVVELCGGFYAAQGETIGEWTADTPADAVVALLKARYHITARLDSSDILDHWIVWVTGTSDGLYGEPLGTELAAVVALADRLKGGAA
jgi:hypothetical protein